MFASFIAAAGRSADENLAIHHEDRHVAPDPEQASRRRFRRTKTS
jgi:hypothetical protein